MTKKSGSQSINSPARKALMGVLFAAGLVAGGLLVAAGAPVLEGATVAGIGTLAAGTVAVDGMGAVLDSELGVRTRDVASQGAANGRAIEREL